MSKGEPFSLLLRIVLLPTPTNQLCKKRKNGSSLCTVNTTNCADKTTRERSCKHRRNANVKELELNFCNRVSPHLALVCADQFFKRSLEAFGMLGICVPVPTSQFPHRFI